MILRNTTANNISFSGDFNKAVKFVNRIIVPANGSYPVNSWDLLPLVLFDRHFQNQIANGNIVPDFGLQRSVDRQFLGGASLFMSYNTSDWSNLGVSPGDYLYSCSAGSGIFFALNVRDYGIFNFPLVGQVTLPGATAGWSTVVRNVGGRLLAYVTTFGGAGDGLFIVDVTDPANMQVLGSLVIGAGAAVRKVRVVGNYAYVVDNTSLYIVNVSDPTTPVFVAAPLAVCGVSPWSLDVVGNYAYIIDGFGGGDSIVDISNPAAPVVVSTTVVTADGYEITVSGNYAYVADGASGFRVIDISNPLLPVSVYQNNVNSGTVYGVYKEGNRVYTTGATRTCKWDVTVPTVPVFNGYIGWSGDNVIGIGDVAYVGAFGALLLLDIANDASFQLLGLLWGPLATAQLAMLGKESN